MGLKIFVVAFSVLVWSLFPVTSQSAQTATESGQNHADRTPEMPYLPGNSAESPDKPSATDHKTPASSPVTASKPNLSSSGTPSPSKQTTASDANVILPPGVLNVGTRKQFFIDRLLVERSQNVRLAVQPPTKIGVAVDTDKPWDEGRIIYPSLVQDEKGEYRIYYYATAAGKNGQLGKRFFAVATSKDGIHWVKPELGLVGFEGSKANNLLPTHYGHVFIDPNAEPDKRYKILHVDCKVGYSADGYRWSYVPNMRQAPYIGDSHNVAFYDPNLKKYVVYLRSWTRQPKMRLVSLLTVDDILKPWDIRPTDDQSFWIWGKDKSPVISDELPVVLALDEKDPPGTDIYTPGVELYPWGDSIYLAFLTVYRHDDRRTSNDGPIDVQLAVSRDGKNFTRPDRRPYFPLGIQGVDGDAGCIYGVPGMIRDGDRIYQYYAGFNGTHHGHVYMDDVRHLSRIYRVEQRLDGFVAAEFDYVGGSLTTPSMAVAGKQLVLNIDCSAAGMGKVELQDGDGRPIAGYTLKDCDWIACNRTAARVTWKGNANLPDRQIVRLRFDFRGTKLYAFQFMPYQEHE